MLVMVLTDAGHCASCLGSPAQRVLHDTRVPLLACCVACVLCLEAVARYAHTKHAHQYISLLFLFRQHCGPILHPERPTDLPFSVVLSSRFDAASAPWGCCVAIVCPR